MTFTHAGEQWLDSWMAENAFVCCLEHMEPWVLEAELLHSLSLPLNIQGNRHHPFAADLSSIRTQAIRQAREIQIPNEGSQQGT